MSSRPDSQDFSVPDSESQSSDSEAESQNCSQFSQDRPKRVDKLCRCWKFRDFIQAEVSDDSSKLRLIEFIRTRLTHNRPACVRSVTVFADLNQYLSAVSDETPTVSIAIVGYIQTNPSRKITMKSWLSSAAWDPVSGGLYSNLDFLSNMDRANNPSVPGWCMLPIFGELGLNNDGRLAARSDLKVCVVFKSRLLNFSPPCDRLSSTEIGRQRTSRETGAAESPPATSCDLRKHKSAYATRRRALAGLVIFCWILVELRIHAVGPATAARGSKREFGDRLPCLNPVRLPIGCLSSLSL